MQLLKSKAQKGEVVHIGYPFFLFLIFYRLLQGRLKAWGWITFSTSTWILREKPVASAS